MATKRIHDILGRNIQTTDNIPSPTDELAFFDGSTDTIIRAGFNQNDFGSRNLRRIRLRHSGNTDISSQGTDVDSKNIITLSWTQPGGSFFDEGINYNSNSIIVASADDRIINLGCMVTLTAAAGTMFDKEFLIYLEIANIDDSANTKFTSTLWNSRIDSGESHNITGTLSTTINLSTGPIYAANGHRYQVKLATPGISTLRTVAAQTEFWANIGMYIGSSSP